MSGPKGGSYRVESAEQREARLLRDAKARYAWARSVWQAAQARVDATASMIGRNLTLAAPAGPAVNAGSDEFERAAAELEAAAEAAVTAAGAAREEFSAGRFAEQVARIAAVAATEQESAESVPPAQRRSVAVDDTPAHPSVDRSRVHQRVQRRLAEFAEVDYDADRVEVLVTDIANAGSESRIDLLISELDVVLRTARTTHEHAVQVTRTRADLEEMAARIADITAVQAEALRHRITEAIVAEMTSVPTGLRADIDAVIADADTAADRRHVIEAMREALEELGYALGPEFDTQLESAKGTAIVAGPTAGYGVKVRLEADANRFSAQAVKSDGVLTSTKEDIEAERRFCSDFAEVTALVRDYGVTLDLDIHLEPGATTVQAVPAEYVTRTATSGAASRRRPTERERSQP